MQKSKIKYSLIIPVFNRPEEIEVVLSCLAKQTYSNFEIIIVESGSNNTAESVVNSYKTQLDAHWFMYKNDGQGFSRNYGMTKATGDYFIILDSDILLDNNYLDSVNTHLQKNWLDAFGGPDKSHDSFTNTQKAVDHVMTSTLTTGGIRGNKKHVGKFYPRSFNMGLSREVYDKTLGYKWPFFGEDIELSRRIMENGFSTGLIPEAHVYHKRKTSLINHWKQMNFFGRARINIYKAFPDTLKVTHFFPALFTIFFLTTLLITTFFFVTNFTFVSIIIGNYSIPDEPQCVFQTLNEHLILSFSWLSLISYLSIISVSGMIKYKSIAVGLISIPATFTQMIGYGTGFIKDFTKRVILGKEYNFINKD